MKLKHTLGAAVFAALGLTGGLAHSSNLDTQTPPTTPPGGPVVTYSQQGQSMTGSTAVTELPTIYVELEADYTLSDDITLTINGATVGGNTNTKLNANNLPPADGVNCGAADPIIVSFVSRTGNSIRLRVTQKNVANTVGVICSITGIDVTDPSLAVLTSVTATWNATTALSNIPFDAGNTLTVASVIDQFTSTVGTALNGVVDVNAPSLRTAFLTDDGFIGGTNDDTLAVTASDLFASITGGTAALINSVTTVITGNFSYLDNDGDGVCGEAGEGAPTVVAPAAATATVASNCQSATLTEAVSTAGGFVGSTYRLSFGSNGTPAKVIGAPQSFNATTTFNYDIGGAATANDTDAYSAGAWTLNGFSAFVGYMPYGANISQIVYLTNKSGQTGEINVSGYNEAAQACNFSAGSIAGGRVLSLSSALQSGFEGCYGAGFSGKVSFNVIANFPSALGELYSAYNVGGSDRGTVVNTSNGRVTLSGDSTTGGNL